MSVRASLRRIAALMRKEALQVVRDPSSIAIAFVLPLILLLLFGYGVSLDIRHLPVAIVLESMSSDTRSLFESFANSPYIRPVAMTNVRDAEAALMRGEGEDSGLRVRGSWRQFDRTVRLFLREEGDTLVLASL